MKVYIDSTNANAKFLAKYNATGVQVKAMSNDPIGSMAYAILLASYNRQKYYGINDAEFREKYRLYSQISLEISQDKRNVIKNLSVNYTSTALNQIAPAQYGWQRVSKDLKKRIKNPSYKVIFNREATVNFNTYLSNVVHRVYLYFMQTEVLIQDRKITDSISKFQELYDLAEEDFSSESCKRFWQRHKNDPLSPYPLKMNAL